MPSLSLINLALSPLLRGNYIRYQEGAIHPMTIHKREWINSELNFDNILEGMLALFTVSTFEGWPK